MDTTTTTATANVTEDKVVIIIPNDFITDPVKPIENEKTGLQKRINVPEHGSALYPAAWIHPLKDNNEFSTISLKADSYLVFQKKTDEIDENGKKVYVKENISAQALKDVIKDKAEYVNYNVPAAWVHDTKNPDYKTISFLDSDKGYVNITVASKFVMPSKFNDQEVHFSFPRISTKEENAPYMVNISYKDSNGEGYVQGKVTAAELKNMITESKKAQNAFRSVSLDAKMVKLVELDGHKPFYNVRYSKDGKSIEAAIPEWAVKIKDGIAKISMPAKKDDGTEFTVSVNTSELQEGIWVDLGRTNINYVSEFVPQINDYLKRQAERAEKQAASQAQSENVSNTEGFENAAEKTPFIDNPSATEEEYVSQHHHR